MNLSEGLMILCCGAIFGCLPYGGWPGFGLYAGGMLIGIIFSEIAKG